MRCILPVDIAVNPILKRGNDVCPLANLWVPQRTLVGATVWGGNAAVTLIV